MNLVVYLFIYFCCMRFKKKHYFLVGFFEKTFVHKRKRRKKIADEISNQLLWLQANQITKNKIKVQTEPSGQQVKQILKVMPLKLWIY